MAGPIEWTGSAGDYRAAPEGIRLSATRQGREWELRVGGTYAGEFPTLRDAKAEAARLVALRLEARARDAEAVERARADTESLYGDMPPPDSPVWNGNRPEAVEPGAVCPWDSRPCECDNPGAGCPDRRRRESRQVRRARERAEHKRATRRGPFDGGLARPGLARSLSAAAPGDTSPAAVPWSTPVRPLTGAARHCVWGGTTPPEQVRSASFAFWRQKGLPAAEAVERMRADAAAGTVRFPAFHTAANPGGGSTRFIEDPESFGFRLEGSAEDLARLDHSGYFLDSEIMDETARGAVYRLPAKRGQARFVAAVLDPYQDGPALFDLESVYVADLEAERADARRVMGRLPSYARRARDYADAAAETAAREAARAADGIAERYAERERDYQDGRRAGAAAREAAAEALETGRAYVAQCRALRALWRVRGGLPALPGPVARAEIRAGLDRLRTLRADYLEAREAARDMRDNAPAPLWNGTRCEAAEGFRNGYAEAV